MSLLPDRRTSHFMPIATISKNEFKLLGLPSGMYDNLDDEAYYGSNEGQAERARDQFYDYAHGLGYNMCVMPDGTREPYYTGVGLPAPEKPLTAAIEKALQKRFFRKRVLDAARATSEFQWLRSARYKFAYPASSYDRRDGSISLIFQSNAQALAFKLAMGGS